MKRIIKFNFNKKPVTFTAENAVFISPYKNETTVFHEVRFGVYQCGKCGILFNIFPFEVREKTAYCPLCGAKRKKES